MVDALRRAHRWLRPGGCVIDLHPTPFRSTIQVGGRPIGGVQTDDALERHAAADAAVLRAVEERLFAIAGAEIFDFFTYGDTLAELRAHIEENWRDARVVATVPDSTPARAREQVRITKLVLARLPD
jgi:hypothetical protein